MVMQSQGPRALLYSVAYICNSRDGGVSVEVSKQKDILRFSIHTHSFHEADPQFPEIEVLVMLLTSRDVMRLENKPDPMSLLFSS